MPACDGATTADATSRQQALEKIERLRQKHAFSNARLAAQDLASLYPDDAQVRIALASVLRDAGLMSEAIKQYSAAYMLNPRLPEPPIALSELHLENLDMELAIGYARLATQLAPSSRAARKALVKALLAAGRFNEADEQIQRLLADEPSNAGLLYTQYQIKRKAGDLTGARLYLEAALSRQPHQVQWLIEQADLLELLKDYQDARQALEKALLIDPNFSEARKRLANNLEFHQGAYAAALGQYRQLLESDPDSVSALAGIDRCLAKQNDLAAQLKSALRHLIHRWFGRP